MHHYTECGLDNIYLRNGFYREEHPEYGELVSVEDVQGLHRAIGCALAQTPRPLRGPEIRFLRRELNLSQKRLANILDIDAQTVARWEKEQTSMSRSDELVLRSYYLEVVFGNGRLRELTDELAELDNELNMLQDHVNRLEFEEQDHQGWKLSQAA